MTSTQGNFTERVTQSWQHHGVMGEMAAMSLLEGAVLHKCGRVRKYENKGDLHNLCGFPVSSGISLSEVPEGNGTSCRSSQPLQLLQSAVQ